MFTGIIETIGEVKGIEESGTNKHFQIKSSFTRELKTDQSVAHNGVCLTVVDVFDDFYTVTAIQETLNKSSLGRLKIGDYVNLERCVQINGRLDGHIVQGHVDTTSVCEKIEPQDGSWLFHFRYDVDEVTVDKGSITVNGISLTVVNSGIKTFSVAVIPYTYENTNLRTLKEGDFVNLEFDIIGKYVKKILKGN